MPNCVCDDTTPIGRRCGFVGAYVMRGIRHKVKCGPRLQAPAPRLCRVRAAPSGKSVNTFATQRPARKRIWVICNDFSLALWCSPPCRLALTWEFCYTYIHIDTLKLSRFSHFSIIIICTSHSNAFPLLRLPRYCSTSIILERSVRTDRLNTLSKENCLVCGPSARQQ